MKGVVSMGLLKPDFPRRTMHMAPYAWEVWRDNLLGDYKSIALASRGTGEILLMPASVGRGDDWWCTEWGLRHGSVGCNWGVCGSKPLNGGLPMPLHAAGNCVVDDCKSKRKGMMHKPHSHGAVMRSLATMVWWPKWPKDVVCVVLHCVVDWGMACGSCRDVSLWRCEDG